VYEDYPATELLRCFNVQGIETEGPPFTTREFEY